MPRKKGRPTLFIPEITDRLIDLIAIGNTIEDACSDVKISTVTFYAWCAIGNAIAAGEDHAMMPKGKGADEQKQRFLDFSNAVMRAKVRARLAAVGAVRSAINGWKQEETSTQVFEETRLNKKGEPYQYIKRTTTTTVRNFPGDARIALEYLKRRDPANWSDRIKVETWQDAFIEAIKRDEIDLDALVDELGDESLAVQLFTKAGKQVADLK